MRNIILKLEEIHTRYLKWKYRKVRKERMSKEINNSFGKFMHNNIYFEKGEILFINNWDEEKQIEFDSDVCIDMVKLDKFIHDNFKVTL